MTTTPARAVDVGVPLAMVAVLGALTAIPPLSFDMYLPALPNIASDLGVAESQVQLTLSACLIGIALGQLCGGPVSDALGRRGPLLAGVAGYTAFSLGCALAPSLAVLVATRFVMGFFGGVAVVISRAIVRDRATGAAAARIFSLLMLVSGVAPVLAPVVGGILIGITSWRGIFLVLAALGVAGFVATLAVLPETLAKVDRRTGGLQDTFAVVRRVASDRMFMGFALTSGCAFGALFVYISSSSFVFQDVYGLSAQGFSAVFAGIAVGLVLVSNMNARLVQRYSPESLLRWGIGQMLVGAVLLSAAVHIGAGLPMVIGALVFTNLGIPLIAPNATALALSSYGHEAGTASAFLGVLQFAIGAIATPIAGAFGTTTQFSMAYGMLVMALLTLGAHAVLVRRPPATADDVLEDPMSEFVELLPGEGA